MHGPVASTSASLWPPTPWALSSRGLHPRCHSLTAASDAAHPLAPLSHHIPTDLSLTSNPRPFPRGPALPAPHLQPPAHTGHPPSQPPASTLSPAPVSFLLTIRPTSPGDSHSTCLLQPPRSPAPDGGSPAEDVGPTKPWGAEAAAGTTQLHLLPFLASVPNLQHPPPAFGSRRK